MSAKQNLNNVPSRSNCSNAFVGRMWRVKLKTMQEIKHWAAELIVGDRAVATIRHKTDGSKNINDAAIIVVANNKDLKTIKGALGGTVYEIPYNELRKYDPHEVSTVECDVCTHKWVAVRPKGLTKLQCPHCLSMAQFENEK